MTQQMQRRHSTQDDANQHNGAQHGARHNTHTAQRNTTHVATKDSKTQRKTTGERHIPKQRTIPQRDATHHDMTQQT